MNVKRFTARTAREALALVREALGDDAVVLSTKPCGEGVEVLALAPEGMARIEQAAAQAPAPRATQPPVQAEKPSWPTTLAERIAARGERLEARSEARQEPTLFGEPAPRAEVARSRAQPEPAVDKGVARDVETLGMSTLTFQDYVRERMLKRRQAELDQQPNPSVAEALKGATAPIRLASASGPASAATGRLAGPPAQHRPAL